MGKINLTHFIGEITGTVLLAKISPEGTSKNGKPYIKLTVTDGETFEDICVFTKRTDFTIPEKSIMEVKLVKNGDFINILEYKKVDGDIKEYIPSAPEDGELIFAKVVKTLTAIKGGIYRNNEQNTLFDLTISVLSHYKDRLIIYPASDSYHHNCLGGMIYYIFQMLQDAYNLSKGSHKIDLEVVASAVCLCEIGKLYTLTADDMGTAERNITGYIRNDVELACNMVDAVAKAGNYNSNKVAALMIAIRSSRSRRAWGNTIEPITEEALFVSTLASLVAKADVYESVKKGLNPGEISEKNEKLGYPVLNI